MELISEYERTLPSKDLRMVVGVPASLGKGTGAVVLFLDPGLAKSSGAHGDTAICLRGLVGGLSQAPPRWVQIWERHVPCACPSHQGGSAGLELALLGLEEDMQQCGNCSRGRMQVFLQTCFSGFGVAWEPCTCSVHAPAILSFSS